MLSSKIDIYGSLDWSHRDSVAELENIAKKSEFDATVI
jgi:hypothetical protein